MPGRQRNRPGYEPDRRGFREFMTSVEIGDAAFAVASDIAQLANETDETDVAGSYYPEPGQVVVVGKRFPNPRRTATVRTDHRKAAAFEFGTGEQGEGKSAGKRKQGGGSPARRHLQKTAQRFHNPIEAPE